MVQEYEINDLAKEESWRMFRIIGELVEGFDKLSGIEPAVSIYGSARISPGDELYAALLLQLAWAVGLFVAGRLIWRISVRHVVVQGG